MGANRRFELEAWHRHLGRFALALCCLLCVPTVDADELNAARWQERLDAIRQQGGDAAVKWLEIGREFPVEADWILQDIGKDAAGLLDPVVAGAGEARLREIVRAADPQVNSGDLWSRYFGQKEERRTKRLGPAISRWGDLAFTEGHTFRMSFIGYTEGLSDARHERFFQPGARLKVLRFADGSLRGDVQTLLDDPHGMMRDVDLSFDRLRLVFAWKKSDRLDDYHLHEYDLASNKVRQLTFGLGRADYEPVYLPCGDLVFASTRPEQSVPCWWTEISNLYRMDGNGRGIRRLAIDQVHTLYPQLLADGRITYTRWDYSDRGQNFPHPLFSMRPDGQDQRAYYGANSWFPNSLLHARGIPGSHQVMAIAAGHHTQQKGKLVIIDPREGRDEGKGMRFIAPKREVPYERVDKAMQDGDQFRYPYPIGDGEFFVSYRPDWGAAGFGLYWMNEAGERELLHASSDLEVARMVPLGRKPEIADLPDEVDYGKRTGTYYVHDVYQGVGLEGVPRGEAKKIRVVRLNYRAAGVGRTLNKGEGGGSINSSPVGISNTSWDVKEILGDVDIHDDGSAMFEVPAMESIYLQVLDARGRVIQNTRTWDTLRPGETKGCAGCHDKANGNYHPFEKEDTEAWKHGVQKLKPFHGAPRGFSFPKEIQPILDAKCTSCHDGSKKDVADFRGLAVPAAGENKRRWSVSYLNLLGAGTDERKHPEIVPEETLVRWISKMSRPTELPPYFGGSSRSPLMEMMEGGRHHGVYLTEEEREKLCAWIDLLVPFCGDYREGAAWNERDHGFYTYYETKRAWQRDEEMAETAFHRARRDGGSVKAGLPDVRPYLRASYREVLSGVETVVGEDGVHSLPACDPVMIDRLWLVRKAGAAGPAARVEIHDVRGGQSLATVAVPSGVYSVDVNLARPVRSSRLRIHTAASCGSIFIEKALGVRVDEVPVVGGFHPFLGDALRE